MALQNEQNYVLEMDEHINICVLSFWLGYVAMVWYMVEGKKCSSLNGSAIIVAEEERFLKYKKANAIDDGSRRLEEAVLHAGIFGSFKSMKAGQ